MQDSSAVLVSKAFRSEILSGILREVSWCSSRLWTNLPDIYPLHQVGEHARKKFHFNHQKFLSLDGLYLFPDPIKKMFCKDLTGTVDDPIEYLSTQNSCYYRDKQAYNPRRGSRQTSIDREMHV